ncbi:MAG: hypothetical protein INH37_05965 [Myxococcaceae bacterium]|nr:hypothetical protein [Myxococcaceae bacterium]
MPGWHTLPEQHPEGHEVASHTHAPPAQRCPVPQGGPPPQRHVPPAHVSATTVLHVEQPPPAVPQALRLLALQVEPLQHPVGHEVPSHTQTPPAHR